VARSSQILRGRTASMSSNALTVSLLPWTAVHAG
jgi:hypothetical protein